MKYIRLFQFVATFSTLIWLTVMTLAQGAPPSVTATPADSKNGSGKRGSITGRVLSDDGEPLADVSVSVSSLSQGRSVSRTITTDDEGNFKAHDLPVGAYRIAATAPGFVNAQSGMLDAPSRLDDNVAITMTKGGVITGKVLDAADQPLVGALVKALRVRDTEGRPVNETLVTAIPRMTDDRGVYRLYGLPAGFYVVCSGGAGESLSTRIGARDVPTYYPSATRDTAREVSVSVGLEVPDINIRHRGEAGYAVSGTIVGAAETGSMVSPTIELWQLGAGTLVATTDVNLSLGHSFGVYGVPDGEYEIRAQQVSNGRNDANSAASAPRRVTVHGGDVTGLELRLIPLSSIAGHVVLEKLDQVGCQITRRGQLAELLLLPQREDRELQRRAFADLSSAATPDDKGEFVIHDLEAGRYRLDPQLPSDYWYVKALSLAGATPAKTPTAGTAAPSFAVSGLTLKSGEKLTGLTLTIAEGAAAVSGHVEGKNLPTRLRIHLVPAEADAASAVLRYAEVVTRDGSFSLTHLAPGKYWLIARAVPDDESNEQPARSAAWDAEARAKLRREAEAAHQSLELTPCQRAKDLVLKF